MSLRRAEPGSEKRLNQVPGDRRTDGSAAHAKDIHVIVFDTLSRGEVVVDQRCTNPAHLVSTHGRADAAAADRDPTLYVRSRHGPSQRKNVIRIVIALAQSVRAEVNNLMSCGAKLRDQVLF
jgi:hypothetical protein